MKILVVLLLGVLLVAPARGEDDEWSTPKSPQATTALAKFKALKEKPNQPYLAAAATALKQYRIDLQRTLDSSLKMANLTNANITKAEIARIDAGDSPSTEKPTAEGAATAWTRYNRSVDRAAAEARRSFDFAKTQCITELKAAQRTALSTAKDISEGNRISHEILRVQTSDFSAPKPHMVNLLALDFAHNVVEGTWEIDNGFWTCQRKPWARVEFPYAPPAEYDFRIVFERVVGNESVNQICYANGHQFMWAMGARGNRLAELGMFNRETVGDNQKEHSSAWLTNGQQHVSVVKVRKNKVEAYLDANLITSLDTNYENASLMTELTLPHTNTLGLMVWDSQVRFITVEVREISGEGTILSSKSLAEH